MNQKLGDPIWSVQVSRNVIELSGEGVDDGGGDAVRHLQMISPGQYKVLDSSPGSDLWDGTMGETLSLNELADYMSS